MSEQTTDKKARVQVWQLLPNLLTITAVCAGLTAIRLGYEGDFQTAARLILAACILDGLDGRLARLMRCPSPIGAELDSLADFANFGVAPVLVLHAWALQDFQNLGWIAVLGYSVCCILRLARFNVSSRLETPGKKQDYFVGVPSPAGAILVMLPMVISFAFPSLPAIPPAIVSLYICFIGVLMISRIRTYSFKSFSIDRRNATFFMLGAALLVASLLTYLWATLTILTIAYAGGLFWAFIAMRKAPEAKE